MGSSFNYYKTCVITDVKIFFFFNNTATTKIYTLSLHDALPISSSQWRNHIQFDRAIAGVVKSWLMNSSILRSEEHTSELQSHVNLVCRLLLEKKKTLS